MFICSIKFKFKIFWIADVFSVPNYAKQSSMSCQPTAGSLNYFILVRTMAWAATQDVCLVQGAATQGRPVHGTDVHIVHPL